MYALLNFSARKYFRDYFPGVPGIAADFFTVLLSLFIYQRTAEAFGEVFAARFSGLGKNYFEYIFLGEITLALPQILFLAFARAARGTLVDGTFDFYRLLPRSLPAALLFLGLGSLAYEAAKLAFMIVLAVQLFGFTFGPEAIALFAALQLLALPIFLGFGLAAAGFFLYFGRGLGLFSHVVMVTEVLAGVYFPLALLPEYLQNLARVFSPFTFLLEATREAMGAGISWRNVALQAAIWALVSLGGSLVLLALSLAKIRRDGSPVVPAA